MKSLGDTYAPCEEQQLRALRMLADFPTARPRSRLMHAFEKRCMSKLVACGYCDRETRTGLHLDRYRITQAGQDRRRVTAMKPMNHTEFSKAIDALGLTQVGAGRFLGVDPRACRD